MKVLSERALHTSFYRILDTPIMTNTIRGYFLESLVEAALAPDWRCNDIWDSWDLSHTASKLRMEVKQSAVRQVWDAPASERSRAAAPRFDIRERDQMWKGGGLTPALGRAEIYVFGFHPVADWKVADQRRAEQWEFYILGRDGLPDAKSISLAELRKRTDAVRADQLRQVVNDLVSSLLGHS